MEFRTMRTVHKSLLSFLVGSVIIALFNEFIIYYIVIGQCSWPDVRRNNDGGDLNSELRAMILSDPHLLGPGRGHWFDKLRREWQMHRAFQTATFLFRPEVIFILGDIFDEGLSVNPKEFQEYVDRFHSLFYVPENVKLVVIVGNHDTGFHFEITPNRNRRFEKAFNTSSVQMLWFKSISFVLVNSMAMEQDGCFLCSDATRKLKEIADELDCIQNPGSKKCKSNHSTTREGEYVQPILLQHFPLYRESDSSCTGDDSAPDSKKGDRFRENWNCISKSSTHLVLSLIRPRLIMSGHTHHGCVYNHSEPQPNEQSRTKTTTISEYSVASFSWRNRDNPSFYLGSFERTSYHLSKCQMPKESTVKLIYAIGIGALIILFCRGLIWNVCRYFVSRIVR